MHGIQTHTASAGRPQGEFNPKSRLVPETLPFNFSVLAKSEEDIMLTMMCPHGTLAVENSMRGLLY